jgi:hypothetical protein
MNPKIPAAVLAAVIAGEAVLDHQKAQPHVESAKLEHVVVPPLMGPPLPTALKITQLS